MICLLIGDGDKTKISISQLHESFCDENPM